MGKNMQSLGKSMTMGLTAPLAAFGALSVKAFAEQEKAESTLRASLQASGQEVDANMQKLKRMASEIQKVTTVGDEMSLAMMQQAVSMGVQADQLDEATRGAIGLSKAFNLDLKMAMRASSAALLGQTEMLTRYIPELKDIEDPAERVALVHLKMGEGFTVATAEANATGGQLIQLKNAFGDLQEQVGEILARPAAWVTTAARNGTIPGRKVGRRWRFLEADITEYLDSVRTGGTTAAPVRRKRKSAA